MVFILIAENVEKLKQEYIEKPSLTIKAEENMKRAREAKLLSPNIARARKGEKQAKNIKHLQKVKQAEISLKLDTGSYIQINPALTKKSLRQYNVGPFLKHLRINAYIAIHGLLNIIIFLAIKKNIGWTSSPSAANVI